jgi:hypothetical protein
MDWARILAFVTGLVDQELLARLEYLAAENRILKALSFPKIRFGLDSRARAESSHHETRCLRSFMPLEWLLPTCSSRAPD